MKDTQIEQRFLSSQYTVKSADHHMRTQSSHPSCHDKGINPFHLKNRRKLKKTNRPQRPAMTMTHLKAPGSLKIAISMFIPNTPATTPYIATTNVAVVRRSSNWIS
ncbi:hypothetical protein GOP47_0019265 [Adiantum capillus-veneris]|uniref:Uncharacterized protein n=1 Tax=Adiantum capillus-veneris TaxID=13818 RepID=A0A9D4ZBH0_ADICA|nr:hypothetical protein GOP47_0019265 [Adiantum capillus-veneris]